MADERCLSCIHGVMQPGLLVRHETETCLHSEAAYPGTDIYGDPTGEVLRHSPAEMRRQDFPCGPDARLHMPRWQPNGTPGTEGKAHG